MHVKEDFVMVVGMLQTHIASFQKPLAMHVINAVFLSFNLLMEMNSSFFQLHWLTGGDDSTSTGG